MPLSPHLLHTLTERPAETAKRWLRRASCQIDFARAFLALRSQAEAGDWQERIDAAERLINELDGEGGLPALEEAVREAERRMEPIGHAAKAYTIHCVGHGHIDMNWMWSWQETVAATHDTFASVLSLMEQYPDLTYSQSQASVYALTERYYPEMFEQIRKRVAEGRWEVTAVHWVEGDKNIASGESLCRHLLYTRRYFQEKFGLSAEDLPLDWEPDTFGHAATIPTILAQAGVKYYYSCRTGGGFDHPRIGEERPPLFWWQGPDGSKVLVCRETTWYNSYVNIGDNIALPMAAFCKTTGLKDWLNIYGIGNHGGGPTRAEIDYYREMREWPVYPSITFGTAKGWFDLVASEIAPPARGAAAFEPPFGRGGALPAGANVPLDRVSVPVLAHELNFEFTGCYTSQSLIKQANRFGENYLEEAETLAAIGARLYDQPHPTGQLEEAWKSVLFNQFHDILPGSGVRQTREHALGLFQEVGAITGSIKRSAGKAIANRIDTLALLPDTPEGRAEKALHEAGAANTPFVAGAGMGAMESGYSRASGGGSRFRPYVVYNPCAWTRSEPVTVDLYDTGFEPSRIVARDETGAQHPTMVLEERQDWGHKRLTVLFLARDIPPLGYRTYLFCEGTPDADEPMVQISGDSIFETPFFKFEYNRFASGIGRFLDKRSNWRQNSNLPPVDWQTERYFEPTGSWIYTTELPRGMTAWALGLNAWLPENTLLSSSYSVMGAIRNGGTNAASNSSIAFRIDQKLPVPGTQSSVKLSTLVHALEPRIDVTAEIDWREIGDASRGIPGLYVQFPPLFGVGDIALRYEAPFGSVTRDLKEGQEVPSLRYADVRSVHDGQSLTLLQDCKYGHAFDWGTLKLRIIRSSFDPDHAPEVNRHTVRYSMYFHYNEADPATLARLGAAWNHPLLVFPASLGDGGDPPTRSFARVETENVVLSALKRAEDGDGLILRLVEQNGAATEGIVTLDPALADGLTSATLCDVMEQPLPDAPAPTWDAASGTLRVPIRAHSFVTVRLA